MSGTREPQGWGVWVHGTQPVAKLVELAVHAEKRGAVVLFIADELVDRDIYVTLAAIAAATDSIYLSPGITQPYSRHPVATAAALATLEELAPGRIVAGLGAGGSLVLGPLGLRPAKPFTALAETADVVTRLLDGQTVTHRGVVTAISARLSFPARRLPLAVAGRGPRVERFAREQADWFLIGGKPIDQVAEAIALTRSSARSVPGSPPALVVWHPLIAFTPQGIAELRAAFGYMSLDIPADWKDRFGVTPELAEQLRAALANGGPEEAGKLVPDALLDGLAVVGSPGQIADRLRGVVRAASPEIVAFGLAAYTVEEVDTLAEIALLAGAARVPAPRNSAAGGHL
ncbi:MAG: LLM class flavin-dependent oxidoreductase [Bifidobacteriaceae bacterium]|nr:LLM class flavin-dependent oxidoreductase [Bifidobacteriaceae bacterium]